VDGSKIGEDYDVPWIKSITGGESSDFVGIARNVHALTAVEDLDSGVAASEPLVVGDGEVQFS
jgi:hypothetical protein